MTACEACALSQSVPVEGTVLYDGTKDRFDARFWTSPEGYPPPPDMLVYFLVSGCCTVFTDVVIDPGGDAVHLKPAGHVLHLVAPAALYSPTSHVVHTGAAGPAANLPATHAVHVAVAATEPPGDAVPGSHGTAAPPTSAYPGATSTHTPVFRVHFLQPALAPPLPVLHGVHALALPRLYDAPSDVTATAVSAPVSHVWHT